MPARRTAYQRGVEWVALNDNAADYELDDGNDYLTIVLLADVFGKPVTEVADDVRRLRPKRQEAAKS